MPSPAAERGSATITLATVAALLLLIVAVIAGALGGITGQEAAACTAQPSASSAAAAIPANYLADFKKAGTEYGIPWTVLAAIGEEESGFGANDGPSSAGALGPMQFLPSTWQQFGDGGNIMDPADAIPAAARLLVANGAPGNLRQAILAYNDAGWYVTDVLDQAARYSAGGAQAISAAGSAVCQQAALGPLPAGAAGKILAYAEAQLGKPYLFGAGRPGRLRLLGPGDDGLPRRRDRHTPHQPGPVGLRPADPGQPGTARRPGLLRRVRRHPGRPRARRHRPGPGRPHDDQRLHQLFPGRSGHLRSPDVQGRALARGRLHPPARVRAARAAPPRWLGGPAWQQAGRHALPALVRLAAVPGRAGFGQPAGAGQEDGFCFQAGQAAGGAVQPRVLGDDV